MKIDDCPPKIEELLWAIWLDAVDEMSIREPFNPIGVIKDNPDCSALFAPVPVANIPQGLPPNALQQLFAQIMQNAVVPIPPAPYRLINAVVESPRHASRFVTDGLIFATRKPDLEVKVSCVPHRACWQTIDVIKSAAKEESEVPAAPQAAGVAEAAQKTGVK